MAYVAELERIESEPLVAKLYGDSFEDTGLEDLLAQRGVGRIVITARRPTRVSLDDARRFHPVMTDVGADAHTTEDLSEYGAPTPDKVIAHTNLYWEYQEAPGSRRSSPHGRRRVSRRRRSVMSNATVLALMCRSRGKPIVYAGLETWPEPQLTATKRHAHRFARATASDIFVEGGGLDAELFGFPSVPPRSRSAVS